MKSFKNFITEQDISKSDMKKLQRAAASKSPEQTKRILDSLESAQERASRRTRTVPSAKSSSTVEQTPLNRYIRGEAESGRRVSQELRDAAGVRDAARRGDIKPVQAGESKPTAGQGQVNRTRARGQAAAAGVDVTPEPSKRAPRNIPLGDTTKGGPVKTMRLGDPGAPSKDAARTLQRMTTASPEQTRALQDKLVKADTPKKPEPIKQSEVSKRARTFRQSFGTPTGANPFTGKATYKPLDALTKLPTSRTGKTPTPQAYGKVQVGDLDTKRLIRTQGPQGTPTPRGVENFLLNRETKGALGGRNARSISPQQGKAALERVKGLMTDPKEVSRVAAQIKQEVGGRRAQLQSPPTAPSRSTAAATGSGTAVQRVRVKVDPPTTPKRPQLPAAPATTKSSAITKPAPAPTVTKVKQALKLNIAPQPQAPEPSFKVPGTTKVKTPPQLPPVGSTTKPEPVKQSDVSRRAQTYRTQVNTPEPSRVASTAGQNLEFKKTKTGSFSYKPQSASTSQAQAPTPEWSRSTRAPLPEPAAPTRRRASGDAGPSSKLSSAPKPPVTNKTPVVNRKNILPDLGSRSTTVRRGQSTTLKPRSATAPKQSGGRGVGALFNLGYGGFEGYTAYKQAIEAGKSRDVALQRGLARGGGTSAGSALGGAIGKRIGGALGSRIRLRPAGEFVGDALGSIAGAMVGGDAATAVMGADKKDKDWMRWANRKVQTGVSAQDARSKTGTTSVIRDASGKERVGYLAYKDGKPVYKTANDPSSLKYTSSNPLERIGRTVASGPYGPVSDWLKARYAASDDAVRRAKVAAQKARAGNK